MSSRPATVIEGFSFSWSSEPLVAPLPSGQWFWRLKFFLCFVCSWSYSFQVALNFALCRRDMIRPFYEAVAFFQARASDASGNDDRLTMTQSKSKLLHRPLRRNALCLSLFTGRSPAD